MSTTPKDFDDPKRMPLTCERFVRGNRLCGEKAIGASFDVNGEYGIGYCQRHEPMFEAVARLKRDHPLFAAFVDSPLGFLWRSIRRGR